ncbi:MAG: hypothetical protein PHV59_02435 [Victivallales bacterium]|nr:hypothetical protein [Victivallales bacterium]
MTIDKNYHLLIINIKMKKCYPAKPPRKNFGGLSVNIVFCKIGIKKVDKAKSVTSQATQPICGVAGYLQLKRELGKLLTHLPT